MSGGLASHVAILSRFSSLFVGRVSTVGDWVWASQLLRHKMWYGLAHGAGLCLAMGLALGAPAGRPLIGAGGGVVAGAAGAASFYLFAPMLRYNAMFLAWGLLWIFIAYLDGPILRRASVAPRSRAASPPRSPPVSRSIAVSGMWTNWNPATINYLDHFLRWAVAFLPGFLALRLARRCAGAAGLKHGPGASVRQLDGVARRCARRGGTCRARPRGSSRRDAETPPAPRRRAASTSIS